MVVRAPVICFTFGAIAVALGVATAPASCHQFDPPANTASRFLSPLLTGIFDKVWKALSWWRVNLAENPLAGVIDKVTVNWPSDGAT